MTIGTVGVNTICDFLNKLHNGSVEGCKQWLNHCKQTENYSENYCLSLWNDTTKRNAELIDGWYFEINFIEKGLNEELVNKKCIIDNTDGVLYEEF